MSRPTTSAALSSSNQIISFVDGIKTLKYEFLKATKKILKKEFSKNPEKHKQYINELVVTYNNFIEFVDIRYDSLPPESQSLAYKEIGYLRSLINRCYGKLNIADELPSSYLARLKANELEESYQAEELPQLIESSDEDDLVNLSDIFQSTIDGQEQENILNFENPELEVVNMPNAMTNPELVRLAAQTINRNYSGDPLALGAFMNSVEFLNEMAGDDQKQLLFKFVKTKLEGKALESISANVNSIDDILDSLKGSIKPDSSKVVEGHMSSLKFDPSKAQDFTEEAEKLAEALQRSLIIEGTSQKKAKEMAVERTVEMCRQVAKSGHIDTIMASSSFDDPKDVVAKFIVESAVDAKKKQVLSFKSFKNKQNNNGKYNNKGQFNKKGQYDNKRGGYQGRGGFKKKGRGGYNNTGYNNNSGYSNQYSNQQYVRVAENVTGPPGENWRALPAPSQIPYNRN